MCIFHFQPVYVDETPRLCRSTSCPEFTFDVEPRVPIFKRKRANSENIQFSSRDMLRIQSDTDLLGIDKEKTFSASAIVKPAELLARVVNVLGNFDGQQRSDDRGVNMFADADILASEKPPIWSIGNNAIMTNSPKRNRALSVAVPNYRKESVPKMDNDYTWTNGESPEKYIESINNKRPGKLSLPTEDLCSTVKDGQPKGNIITRLFRKSSSTESPSDYIKNTMRGRLSITPQVTDSPKEKHKPRRGSIFPTFDLSDEKTEAEKYKEKTKRGRHSIFPTFDFNTEEDDMAKAYKEKTKRGRHSIFPTFDFSETDDDDMAKAYKEKTKKGRHSIFPTFDFNDDEDDNMAKAYKEKTKRGRHSIFPTFDFNDDEDEDDNMARAYKEKTKKGRHSIFPTFDFSEEEGDSAKSYKSKTKHGRHSIFPTFDFSEDVEEDLAKKYKEATKKGRRSLFPTFHVKDDKNDDVSSLNEEELKSYQNRTRKGRGSLFPSFGRSKKGDQDDDVIPDDSEEVKNYQNKTKRGRASLFPSFGKDRKNSDSAETTPDLEADILKYRNQTKKGRNSLFAGDVKQFRNSAAGDSESLSDIENYRNRTKKGRGSLFDPDVNITELPQEEQVEVLEQTSVADLLRVLAVIESMTPSEATNRAAEVHGLSELLSGAAAASNAGTRRRGSLRPDFVLPSRSDLEESGNAPRRRRISARAAAPQFTPTLATVVAGAELQTTAKSARENRMSMLAQNPPTYSESTGSQEDASQARVRRYSPAAGGPISRISGPVPRLFSRIRKESVTSVDEESSRRGSLTDVVIDNNKDKT